MLTAALLTIAQMWKQPKGPLDNERINKTSYVSMKEYNKP